MATRKSKPSTQDHLAGLADLLSRVNDDTLSNDPLVAEQRQRILAQREAEDRQRVADSFSGVTSSVDSTAEIIPERGWARQLFDDNLAVAGGVVDAAQAGIQRSLGAREFLSAESINTANESGRRFQQLHRDSADSLAASAKANEVNVDRVREVLKRRGGVAAEVGEAVLDAASSPSSLVSLIGGPLALVGMEDVRGQEYEKARRAGLSEGAAQQNAVMQAVPEAIGFIPAGKLLTRIPGISGLAKVATDRLQTTVARATAQAGVTALGEGTGEAITTLAQAGMHRINAELAEDPELRKYAQGELPKSAGELGTQVWRSFKAGAVMGGPIGGIEGRFTAAADAGKMVTDFNSAIDDAIVDSRNTQVDQARANAARTAAPEARATQGELFPDAIGDGRTFEQAELDRQNAYERGALDQIARRRTFEQMEAEQRVAEETQREDMFRQMELDREAANNPSNPMAEQLARVGGAIRPRVSNPDPVLPADTSRTADPVTEPQQLELPVTTPQARDRAVQEANKAIKAEAKDTLAKQKTKRAADRRKFAEDQMKQTASLPQEERANVIADRMLEWDNANPVPTAQRPAPVSQTVAPESAPAPTATQSRADRYEAIEQQDNDTAIREEMEAMRQFYPNATDGELRQQIAKDSGRPVVLESKARVPANKGATLEDVRKAVVGDVGSNTNANVLAAAVGRRRVKLIDSDAQRPEGAPQDGAALYDGNDLIVDVRFLDKDNIRGDLLTYIAHEAKHSADFSGNNKTGIASFIGFENNRRLNQSIKQQAANGDPTATVALEAAERATQGDASLLEIELPAYYINAARSNASPGIIGAIQRRIVSPIRVKAKEMMGINNVNLDDVYYLSDRLLGNVAEGTESLAGDMNQDPLATIYNESSTGFNQAEAEGRTYTSLDGKRKYVLSDSESSMKPNAYQRLREATDPISLGDLLSHDVLYREHPEASNIPVIAVDSLDGARAEWNDTEGAIYIAKDMMRKVSPRQSLMHEVQHFVQSEGGQSGNFFTTHTNPTLAQAKTTASNALAENDRASRLLLDRASDLRQAASDPAAFDNVLYNTNLPEWRRAADIVNMLDPASLSDASARAVDRFNSTRESANEASISYNGEMDNQLAGYFRNITEREAHFTEGNVDVPQSQLPLNPEIEAMREARPSLTDDSVDITDGQIDVPRVLASGSVSDVVAVTPKSGVQGLDNKLWNAVKGSVSYHGGLGKSFDDMLQNSVGEAAHYASMAQRNMSDLDRGIDAMATKMNAQRKDVTSKAEAERIVKDTVFQRMQALEKISDPKRRESALAAWVRDNPELKPLMRMYSDITEMSNQLANNLAASVTTPNKADAEFIQKIRDSGFGYMTRIYQTHTGAAGRKLAERFLKNAAAAQRRVEQGKDLNAKQTEAAKVYTDAADYLMERLAIPSVEDMQGMKQNRLNDLFNTWTEHDVDTWYNEAYEDGIAQGMIDKEAKAHAKDSMIAVLDARRDIATNANLNAKAGAVIRELLGVSGKPGRIAQRIGGLRQDRGILQKREDLPAPIERLMGRVTTEPSVVLANTLAKQGELLARTKFLLALRDSGMMVTKDVAGTAGNEKFSFQLGGETAGPLDGYYTTPQVANVVNSTLEIYSSATDAFSAAFVDSAAAGWSGLRKGADVVAKGASIAKLSSIVFDAFNLGMNTIGSPLMLAMNGVVNPVKAFNAATAAKDSVANVFMEGGAKFNALLEDGIRYQVVDSARAQELRKSTHDALKERVLEGTPIISPLGKAVGKIKSTAVETFSMSDAWVKLAAFQDRVDFLTDFYKKEGITRSMEEIKTEAGNTVRDTNITYGKTPPFLRAVERYGISTFMPYFYNVPRMIVKSTLQGVSDVAMGISAKNPEAKVAAIQKGVMRLAGNAAGTYGAIMATRAMAALMNADNEDEVDEMKKMLRDDARFADPIYLGKNKDGIPLFFRTSRVDPMGPVTDIARVALDDSIDEKDKMQIIGEQVKGLLFMNRFVAAGAGALLGTDKAKTPKRIERVPVLSDATGLLKDGLGYNRGTNAIIAIADSLLPGTIDAFDPNNPSLADGSEAGDFADVLAMITRVSGGRVDKADPKAVVRDLSFRIKEIKDDARINVADRIRRGASEEGTAKSIAKANSDIYDLMSRMTDVYEGMVDGMDMSPTAAMKVLKEDGSLNSIQISNVRRGLPRDNVELSNRLGGVLSKRSLEEAGKRLGRSGGSDTQEDYSKRAKETVRQLEKYGLKAGD